MPALSLRKTISFSYRNLKENKKILLGIVDLDLEDKLLYCEKDLNSNNLKNRKKNDRIYLFFVFLWMYMVYADVCYFLLYWTFDLIFIQKNLVYHQIIWIFLFIDKLISVVYEILFQCTMPKEVKRGCANSNSHSVLFVP